MTELNTKDRYLLIILAIFLSVPPFFSIFLTRIDIYYTALCFPIAVLIAALFLDKKTKAHWFYQLKESFTGRLSPYVLMIFFTPFIWGLFQSDYFYTKHENAHWVNASTIFIVPLFYFTALAAINCLKLLNISKHFQLFIFTALFGLSFSVDWFYSLYKSLILEDYRWNGSAGNANIWACESALVLLLSVVAFMEFKKNETRLKAIYIIPLIIFSSLALIGIVKAFSLATLLGLSACLMSLLAYKIFKEKAWNIAAIILLLTGSTLIFYILFGDLNFKAKELFLAKKFFPRIKLWRNIDEIVLDFSFMEYLFGIGFHKYTEWLLTLKKSEFNHTHNFFFHYFIQYGIIGFISSTLLYFRIFLEKNLYLKLTSIFLIVISFFDVSLFFEEVQILFFLALPILQDPIPKRLTENQ